MAGSPTLDSTSRQRTGLARWLTSLASAMVLGGLLSACGGGGGSDPAAPAPGATGNDGSGPVTPADPPSAPNPDFASNDGDQAPGTEVAAEVAQGPGVGRSDALRLLSQASFGPSEPDLQRAMSLGLAGWVDEQLAKPARQVHWSRWLADDAQIKLGNPRLNAGGNSVVSSFYQQALLGDDQLRQRMAFALGEIFVVSHATLHGYRAESVAAYQDLLTRNAFGNFRTLLEDVTLSPAMGQYLSTLGNRREDPASGRIPDQNFGREVMQLFSIGLVQLNPDGSPKIGPNGLPIETYTADDIVGMSRVFTGYYWASLTPGAPSPNGVTFSPQRQGLPMQGYSTLHSASEKRFLGTVVAAQAQADVAASRKVALDTLYRHPNVGPFISRQLIQRLVTSNPSPAYVARVAAVFNNNGQGVRGDLKAVLRALLLDAEARSATVATGNNYGKLREPVLRLTALLRAYKVRSVSGQVQVAVVDDPGFSIGQAPLGAPSVFNFFRPGFVPPGGQAQALGLVVPEMQTTDEVSVAGYANTMMTTLSRGFGRAVRVGTNPLQPDLQLDYSADQALAGDAVALVNSVCGRLLTGTPSAGFKSEVVAAVNSIVVPALLPNRSNQAKVDAAKLNRVRVALLLTVVSPEFLVQK